MILDIVTQDDKNGNKKGSLTNKMTLTDNSTLSN